LSFSAAGERKGNGAKEKHEEVSRKLLILKGFSVSQKSIQRPILPPDGMAIVSRVRREERK
jgi:hypothetical protein